jgi:hypothetical protein
MNRAFFMTQTNDMLGNNIMNPQQQQQKWMDKPIGDAGGLAYLKPLDSLLAKQVVSLTESMKSIKLIEKKFFNYFFKSDEWNSISSKIWNF